MRLKFLVGFVFVLLLHVNNVVRLRFVYTQTHGEADVKLTILLHARVDTVVVVFFCRGDTCGTLLTFVVGLFTIL